MGARELPMGSSESINTSLLGYYMQTKNYPPITCYRFRFKALDSVRLPPYSGSTWRGILGYGLRRAVCMMRDTECSDCLLATGCAYAFLFESLASTERARQRSDHIPPPYILHLGLQEQREFEAGATLELEIRLVGRANQHLPYLVHAFNIAGQRGIGRDQSRFEVERVDATGVGSESWATVYAGGEMQEPVTNASLMVPGVQAVDKITLLTPLRIKRHGRLITPRTFQIEHFFSALARRIAEIGEYYGAAGKTIHWPDLLGDQAVPQPFEVDLRWWDWTRYSARQKSSMQMGGLIGALVFEPGVLAPWSDLLWLGQWLHVGKTPSMGLGAYRLDGNIAAAADPLRNP